MEASDALGEAASEVALRTFAFRCLNSGNDVIIVSHETTIRAFVAILSALSEQPYADRRNGPLKPGQFIRVMSKICHQ
jgi:broad specificity phosphatase PhoE